MITRWQCNSVIIVCLKGCLGCRVLRCYSKHLSRPRCHEHPASLYMQLYNACIMSPHGSSSTWPSRPLDGSVICPKTQIKLLWTGGALGAPSVAHISTASPNKAGDSLCRSTAWRFVRPCEKCQLNCARTRATLFFHVTPR